MNKIQKWGGMAGMVAAVSLTSNVCAERVWLDELQSERIQQGWGQPHARQSVGGKSAAYRGDGI